MAESDVFIGVVSAVVALITWTPWYQDLFRVNRLAAPASLRVVLGVTPVASCLVLFSVLETSAANAVRESSFYVLLYLVLGIAALGVSAHLYPFLGLSVRDDVLERRNRAALAGIIGGLLGSMFCFVGGNIGEGPGVEVVVVSVLAALGTWFLLWYLLEVFSGRVIAERITVERDLGAGLRLAAILAANGMILGTAAAGNWVQESFLHDFAASAWPALVLCAAAGFMERVFRARSFVVPSLLTACGYLVVAIVWVIRWGFAT